MRKYATFCRGAVSALLPFAYLLLLWQLNAQSFSVGQVLMHLGASLVIVIGTTLVVHFKIPSTIVQLVVLCLVCVFWVVAAIEGLTLWVGLALTLLLVWMFAVGLWAAGDNLRRMVWIGVVVCVTAGLIVITTSLVRSRFSEEEFFVAVQGLLLIVGMGVAWVAVWWANLRYRRRRQQDQGNILIWLMCSLSVVCGVTLLVTYPQSFYPPDAPTFPGINAVSPFLCGEAAHLSDETYDAAAVKAQIVRLVIDNPQKSTPEFGQLALMTNDPQWRQAFHDALLADARAGMFTEPANSVKFGQYSAAMRAYFYWKVNLAFPELFTASDQSEVRAWLNAVNRRALTVEWVDWLYALAFAEIPQGPYLNQENGAGLLALLEATGLADQNYSQKNRAFLENHPGGWMTHFRNIDDSLSYQSVWINNALFQAMYQKDYPPSNQRVGFQWQLLQALPNGDLIGYNAAKATLVNSAFLGALYLQDPNLLWLSGRSAAILEEQAGVLSAQVGAEAVKQLTGTSPTSGSCLMFANSGNSNRLGTLAPDKIVFRSGWTDQDSYLLLNLRFTGWHRYKAANAIVAIYQNGLIVDESQEGEASNWLPVGRSKFRDKRIPRENLNGFVLEKQGVDRFIYFLTGFGSLWAQDPPWYARVLQFKTSDGQDYSESQITWNGWIHTRKIFLNDSGLVIIYDFAEGQNDNTVGFMWHVFGSSDAHFTWDRNSFSLFSTPVGRNDQSRWTSLPVYGEEADVTLKSTLDEIGADVFIGASNVRKVGNVSVFASGKWIDAQPHLEYHGQEIQLIVESGTEQGVFILEEPLP